MLQANTIVYLLIALSAGFALLLVVHPGLIASRGGKILAFVALFLLPVLTASVGTSQHLEHSKQTHFCLSCHTMEDYGRSLYVDDPSAIPASHFQNIRVPRDQACYTCHTDYTLFGGLNSKLRGLRHVYVQYLGTPSQPIKLYQAYNNRECLHCHAGARSFEEGAVHNADPEALPAIKSNQLSCMSGGCHELVHDVPGLKSAKFWSDIP